MMATVDFAAATTADDADDCYSAAEFENITPVVYQKHHQMT